MVVKEKFRLFRLLRVTGTSPVQKTSLSRLRSRREAAGTSPGDTVTLSSPRISRAERVPITKPLPLEWFVDLEPSADFFPVRAQRRLREAVTRTAWVNRGHILIEGYDGPESEIRHLFHNVPLDLGHEYNPATGEGFSSDQNSEVAYVVGYPERLDFGRGLSVTFDACMDAAYEDIVDKLPKLKGNPRYKQERRRIVETAERTNNEAQTDFKNQCDNLGFFLEPETWEQEQALLIRVALPDPEELEQQNALTEESEQPPPYRFCHKDEVHDLVRRIMNNNEEIRFRLVRSNTGEHYYEPFTIEEAQPELLLDDEVFTWDQIEEFHNHFLDEDRRIAHEKVMLNSQRDEALNLLEQSEARRILREALEGVVDRFRTDRVRRYCAWVSDQLLIPRDLELFLVSDAELSTDSEKIKRKHAILDLLKPKSGPTVTVDPVVGIPVVLIKKSDSIEDVVAQWAGAQGGIMVLSADELERKEGLQSLLACLKDGEVQVRLSSNDQSNSLDAEKPEPWTVNNIVVMLGAAGRHDRIAETDPEGASLLTKATYTQYPLADRENIRDFAATLLTYAEREGLRPISPEALKKVMELLMFSSDHSETFAASYTVATNVLKDANSIARSMNAEEIQEEHILQVLEQTNFQQGTLSDQIHTSIRTKQFPLETEGVAVGQVNVIGAVPNPSNRYAPVSGFPTCIHVTAAPHNERAFAFDRPVGDQLQSALTRMGSFLDRLFPNLAKKMYVLVSLGQSGYTIQNLSGQSISGAMALALCSALTGIPIRQDYFVTAKLIVNGEFEAIRTPNLKTAAVYDLIKAIRGTLNGNCGVVLPKSNASQMMIGNLRPDMAADIDGDERKFGVESVENMDALISFMMGTPAEVVYKKVEQKLIYFTLPPIVRWIYARAVHLN